MISLKDSYPFFSSSLDKLANSFSESKHESIKILEEFPDNVIIFKKKLKNSNFMKPTMNMEMNLSKTQ